MKGTSSPPAVEEQINTSLAQVNLAHLLKHIYPLTECPIKSHPHQKSAEVHKVPRAKCNKELFH